MKTKQPKRIGIFTFVSDRSVTKRFRQEAKKRNVKLEIINFSDVHIAVKPPRRFTIYIKDEKYSLPPVVINRLAATSPGTALVILNHFQQTGRSKILNRAYRTSLARDKFRTIQTLASRGFSVPATVLLGSTKEKDLRWAIKAVGGLPAVLKLSRGSRGVGVILVESMSALRSTYDLIKRSEQPMILQQYLASEPGVDYRFYMVGPKVVAAMRRSAKSKTEFRANISRGGKGENYKPTKEENLLALRVARAIGLDVCGIDFIKTEDGLMPIEVNVCAGLKGIEKATGVNVAGKIIDYCLVQARLFEQKKQLQKENRAKKISKLR